jgi:hypothetical protein
MGLKLEDRKPITEVLQQTPEIPSSCQWSLFLRNHDELTLENGNGRGTRLHVRHVRRMQNDAAEPRNFGGGSLLCWTMTAGASS